MHENYRQTRREWEQARASEDERAGDRVVHEYDEIDLDIVRDTAVNSLPISIIELEKVVPADS
jgi:uncharacterized protein with HEPN domain